MGAKDDHVKFRLPAELKHWARRYTNRNNTTISALLVQFLTRLQRESMEPDDVRAESDNPRAPRS